MSIAVVTKWFGTYGFADWEGKSCFFSLSGYRRVRFYNGSMIRVADRTERVVRLGDHLVVHTHCVNKKGTMLAAWSFEDEAFEALPVWVVFRGTEVVSVTNDLAQVFDYFVQSTDPESGILVKRIVC